MTHIVADVLELDAPCSGRITDLPTCNPRGPAFFTVPFLHTKCGRNLYGVHVPDMIVGGKKRKRDRMTCPSLVVYLILVVYPTLVVYPKLVVYPTMFAELSVLDQVVSRRLMFGVRLSTSRCLHVRVLMHTSMPYVGAECELSLHLPTHALYHRTSSH